MNIPVQVWNLILLKGAAGLKPWGNKALTPMLQSHQFEQELSTHLSALLNRHEIFILKVSTDKMMHWPGNLTRREAHFQNASALAMGFYHELRPVEIITSGNSWEWFCNIAYFAQAAPDVMVDVTETQHH